MREQLETTARRSALMRSVGQSETSAELAVRRLLFKLGARYRVNLKDLPGRPDIGNKSRRKAIFVHGCFWHNHKGCERGRVPHRNASFWRRKFADNRRRDGRKIAELEALGFDVLVIWECELEKRELLGEVLARFWGIDTDEVEYPGGISASAHRPVAYVP